MKRREFLRHSGIAAASLGLSQVLHSTKLAAKTGGLSKCHNANVLMMTCHDIGRHIGCYGVKTVHTDNIDALAQKGIRFQNYFATDCVCSPSRGVILTGRYPQANGLMGLTHQPWEWSLKKDEKHIAAILGRAGYETTLVGLQHVTSGNPASLGYRHVLSKERKADKTVQAAKQLLKKAGSSLLYESGILRGTSSVY